MLLRFGFFELGQFLFPLGGSVGAANLLVELYQIVKSFLERPFASEGNLAVALLHALIAGEQQLLRLHIFFLAEQNAAQRALGAEGLPVIGLFLFADLQTFLYQKCSLGEAVPTVKNSGQVS